MTAVLTKIPLKKIEKPVFASTCVFVNQKLNGHVGIFILKPKKKKQVSKYIRLLFILFKL